MVTARTGVSNDGEFCRMKGDVEGRPSCLRLRDFGCGRGWQGDWKPGAGKLAVPGPAVPSCSGVRGLRASLEEQNRWNALPHSPLGLSRKGLLRFNSPKVISPRSKLSCTGPVYFLVAQVFDRPQFLSVFFSSGGVF